MFARTDLCAEISLPQAGSDTHSVVDHALGIRILSQVFLELFLVMVCGDWTFVCYYL